MSLILTSSRCYLVLSILTMQLGWANMSHAQVDIETEGASHSAQEKEIENDQVPNDEGEAEIRQALEIEPVTFSLTLQEKAEKEVRDQMIGQVSFAMKVLWNYPPSEGNSFFRWTGSRDVLKNRRVGVHLVTDAKDPVILPYREKFNEEGKAFLDESKSITVVYGSEETDDVVIHVFLFTARIFYGRDGKSYPAPLARALVTLGHEFYGHVGKYLEKPREELLLPQTMQSFRESEAIAFTESAAFLKRLIDSPEFTLFSEASQKHLGEAYERELEQAAAYKKILETKRAP